MDLTGPGGKCLGLCSVLQGTQELQARPGLSGGWLWLVSGKLLHQPKLALSQAQTCPEREAVRLATWHGLSPTTGTGHRSGRRKSDLQSRSC